MGPLLEVFRRVWEIEATTPVVFMILPRLLDMRLHQLGQPRGVDRIGIHCVELGQSAAPS